MGRKVHSWEITFASFQTVNCKIHNAEARKNGMEQTVEHHGSVTVQWRTTPASVATIAHFSTVKKRSPSTFCNSRGDEFHIFRIPQSHKQAAFTWGTQEARKAPVLNDVPGAWRESKNMECLSNALITQHLPLGYHFILTLLFWDLLQNNSYCFTFNLQRELLTGKTYCTYRGCFPSCPTPLSHKRKALLEAPTVRARAIFSKTVLFPLFHHY